MRETKPNIKRKKPKETQSDFFMVYFISLDILLVCETPPGPLEEGENPRSNQIHMVFYIRSFEVKYSEHF